MSKFGWAHVEGTHAKGVSGSVQYKDGELQPTTEVPAYVYVAPEMMGGMSASDFRSAMSSDSDETAKKKVFQQFFGKFDQKVFDFINKRLNNDS